MPEHAQTRHALRCYIYLLCTIDLILSFRLLASLPALQGCLHSQQESNMTGDIYTARHM